MATGINRLEQSKAESKVMILITDGVNNSVKIDPISAAKIAVDKKIKVIALELVTKKEPIPIYHPTYGKRYARHPNGQKILTEFDDTILKEIAATTNAAYFNATNTEELKKVYEQINQLEKTVIETNRNYIVFDLFPYFIGIIFLRCYY